MMTLYHEGALAVNSAKGLPLTNLRSVNNGTDACKWKTLEQEITTDLYSQLNRSILSPAKFTLDIYHRMRKPMPFTEWLASRCHRPDGPALQHP